jgi:hypothetical protein
MMLGEAGGTVNSVDLKRIGHPKDETHQLRGGKNQKKRQLVVI